MVGQRSHVAALTGVLVLATAAYNIISAGQGIKGALQGILLLVIYITVVEIAKTMQEEEDW